MWPNTERSQHLYTKGSVTFAGD